MRRTTGESAGHQRWETTGIRDKFPSCYLHYIQTTIMPNDACM